MILPSGKVQDWVSDKNLRLLPLMGEEKGSQSVQRFMAREEERGGEGWDQALFNNQLYRERTEQELMHLPPPARASVYP